MNEGGILLNIRFSVKKDEGRKKYLFDESEIYNFGDGILNAHIINEKRRFLFSVGMNSLFSGEEGHLSFVAKRKLITIFILLYCLPEYAPHPIKLFNAFFQYLFPRWWRRCRSPFAMLILC